MRVSKLSYLVISLCLDIKYNDNVYVKCLSQNDEFNIPLPSKFRIVRSPLEMAGKSRSCGLTCFTGLRQIVSQLSNTIEIGHFFIAFLLLTERKTDRPFKLSPRNLELHFMS